MLAAMWKSLVEPLKGLSFLKISSATRSVEDNLYRIINADFSTLPILTIFEYQWYVMTRVVKHIHMNKKKDKGLVELLEYLCRSCDYLTTKYARQLARAQEQNSSRYDREKEEKAQRGEILRNQYKLCNRRELCDYKYRKNICGKHHYVHNLVAEDLRQVLKYLETHDIDDEVMKSITTVRYVVHSMYSEFAAKCNCHDSTEHDRFYV